MAKEFLSTHQVPFEDVDVSAPEAADTLTARTGGVMATPVVLIGGEMIIGWDRARVKTLLGL